MATQQVALCGVRDQFPVFGQTLPNGQPVTFLDTAASAQKPICVIEAEESVQKSHYANAYRGVYEFGAQIDEELEATREAIRKLIGAVDASEIVFTSGSTMSINMIAFGWGGRHLQEGDEIVLNEMEHHANLVPWQQVAERTGAKIVYIPLTEDGQLDLLAFDELVNERTRVLSVTGMSNVLGTINPVRRLADRVHEAGGIVVVDGAQSVPHAPVDVQADGIDFLVFSGHKLYGPTGVGVLYGRKDLLAEMDALLFGGHMIERVTKSGSTWAGAPAKFEAGTLPIVQAIALKSAIDFVNELGFEAIHEQESRLTRYAMDALTQVPGLKIYGPRLEDRGAIVSFTIDGAHPEDLAQLLNRKGVFVRHGHHCTMPLHDLLTVSSTVRASFGVYNTTEDVDQLVAAIEFARQRLRLA
ncbi:SufS family cysteine desulfurase [Thalassoglobus sp. JC818]|uniref:aminotransferase class V-fold PLP-dependent enzyme n=1 Tax=Thalassoglobus sp. JC818 TaxID=3232136 RepID=UPI003459E9F8